MSFRRYPSPSGSALPPGASTSALQTTGNSSLSSIDTKTPALGQALAASSVPVVLTAAQLASLTPLTAVAVNNFPGTQAVSGTVAVSALPALPAGGNAIGSVSISNLPAVYTDNITQIGGAAITLGQKTAAASFPVALPTDLVVPVSATALPLPAGASTSALQSTLNTSAASIDTKTPALGQALAAGSVPVVLTAAQIATLTPLAAVAINNLPSIYTDNITQIGGTAISLGQKTAAASFPVTPASDYIPPSPKGRTSNFIYRNVYSGNSVLTTGYLQVAAVTSSNINEIEIFDSSGQTMALAVGSAGLEVNQVYIFPGGNGRMPLFIASGSRISLIAISASATVGEININFYS